MQTECSDIGRISLLGSDIWILVVCISVFRSLARLKIDLVSGVLFIARPKKISIEDVSCPVWDHCDIGAAEVHDLLEFRLQCHTVVAQHMTVAAYRLERQQDRMTFASMICSMTGSFATLSSGRWEVYITSKSTSVAQRSACTHVEKHHPCQMDGATREGGQVTGVANTALGRMRWPTTRWRPRSFWKLWHMTVCPYLKEWPDLRPVVSLYGT